MTKHAPTILVALMVAAAAAAADNAPALPAPPNAGPEVSPAAGTEARDASNIVLAPRQRDYLPAPPTDSDGVTRTVSPAVAAALASGMPKYSPPTPTPARAAEPQDLRDIDKPKNEIRRLPTYVVRESRPPVFRDRDIFTNEGLISLSIKSHAGLLIGDFKGLNSYPAYEMYMDDQRLENLNDLADTAHAMAVGGDAAEGRYILQQSQDANLRHSDDWSQLNDHWDFSGTAEGNTGGRGK